MLLVSTAVHSHIKHTNKAAIELVLCHQAKLIFHYSSPNEVIVLIALAQCHAFI